MKPYNEEQIEAHKMRIESLIERHKREIAETDAVRVLLLEKVSELNALVEKTERTMAEIRECGRELAQYPGWECLSEKEGDRPHG